jgi:hypothetical protein
MLHFLTSPAVVRATPLPSEWSVLSLLSMVARWKPGLHALIDVGALVTGMSNLQVVSALLSDGLAHVKGAVFIDDDGYKRILLREGMRVMRLEQCGLDKAKRFSFFDQARPRLP